MLKFKTAEDVRSYDQPKTYRKHATADFVQIQEPFVIDTLEYECRQCPAGSFVGVGIDNEIWPVQQDIFEQTYELAEYTYLSGTEWNSLFNKLKFMSHMDIMRVFDELHKKGVSFETLSTAMGEA